MTPKNELIWDSMPKGERSSFWDWALNEWKKKGSESNEHINDLLETLDSLQKEKDGNEKIFSEAECKDYELAESIENIQEQLRKVHSVPIGDVENPWLTVIKPELFWNIFLEEAEKFHAQRTMFTSPSGRNRYRIQDIIDDQVFVERVDSKSPKPSSFTFETVRKAVIKMCRKKADMMKTGGFMPVLAQECAVVAIHPNLSRSGEFIIYSKEVDL
jgi:hypothetical protein